MEENDVPLDLNQKQREEFLKRMEEIPKLREEIIKLRAQIAVELAQAAGNRAQIFRFNPQISFQGARPEVLRARFGVRRSGTLD